MTQTKTKFLTITLLVPSVTWQACFPTEDGISWSPCFEEDKTEGDEKNWGFLSTDPSIPPLSYIITWALINLMDIFILALQVNFKLGTTSTVPTTTDYSISWLYSTLVKDVTHPVLSIQCMLIIFYLVLYLPHLYSFIHVFIYPIINRFIH